MTITSIPTRVEGSVGGTKTDKRTPTGASTEWSAAQINATLDAVVGAVTELGKSDGTTTGSINEERTGTIVMASGAVKPGFSAVVVNGGTVALELPEPVAGRVTRCELGGYILSQGGITIERGAGPTAAILVDETGTVDLVAAPYTLPGSTQQPTTDREPRAWTLLGISDGAGSEIWWMRPALQASKIDRIQKGYEPDLTLTVAGTSHNLTTTPARCLFITQSNTTITMPDPTLHRGQTVRIQKVHTAGGSISLARFGSEKIQNVSATYALPGSAGATFPWWEVISDGVDWWVNA